MISAALYWCAAWSVAAFAVCGWDKRCARKGRWRVPERVLWLLSAIGGAAGMLAGMGVFHHKTKHPAFICGVPLLLIVHLAAIAALVLRS